MEKQLATFEDFSRLDIRVGTILTARPFPKARRPAYQLTVDFGPEIADFMSEVLVLGTYSAGGVILITPQQPAANGDRLG